ncbi:hypothetical protein [Algibacter sp. 2305UL17-15]|uniref:FKBP-type peptidyl-prolyl cis-trans isomerase n=1 Tax=Algibacter sp. 2305UL17-15 TaxID=3231268 RepID=UPI00345B1EA3
MSLRKIGFLILCLMLGLSSCKKDDDATDIPQVVIRDRGEQQMADNDSIIKYLTTHYYNAGAFEGNTNPKISELIIDEIPESGVLPNATDKVLFTDDGIENDEVETETITFASVEYKIYFLRLNTGGGEEFIDFSDRISYTYEGSLLEDDDSVFDSAVTPVQSNLIGNGVDDGGLIAGFRKIMPEFKGAESLTDNGDGTFNFSNHGTGVMFLPSGLAYFANPRQGSGIPLYAPLIFKFELYKSFNNDYDNDGVPSHIEDIDGDGEFSIDPDDREKEGDDDTDNDGTPDFVDADDDGDGVLTKDEIKIRTVTKDTLEEVQNETLNLNEQLVEILKDELNNKFVGTIIEFTDTDDDTIPDYLDAD